MGSDHSLAEQQAQPAGGLRAIAQPVFQITVVPTRECFDCPPDKPILAAAHAANILISSSCRNGQCGSCIGKLLAGEISYANGLPDALSVEQADSGYVLFCSAYAISDLRIELLEPDYSGERL